MGELENNLKKLVEQARANGEVERAQALEDMLEAVEEHETKKDANPTAILERVDNVVKEYLGDSAAFLITFKDSKTIRLTHEEIARSPTAFRAKYLAVYEVYPRVTAKTWPRFVDSLLAKILVRSEGDTTSEASEAALALLRAIQGSVIVDTPGECIAGYNRACIKPEDATVLLFPSVSVINAIRGFPVTIQTLRAEMTTYLAGNAIQRRVEGRKHSFWQLRLDRIEKEETPAMNYTNE